MLTQLNNRADIYEHTTVRNDAGQQVGVWTLKQAKQKCFYTPLSASHGGERKRWRTHPTLETNEITHLLFEASAPISEYSRVYNITDRRGRLLDPGPLSIDSITTIPGYGGAARHIVLKLRRVEED